MNLKNINKKQLLLFVFIFIFLFKLFIAFSFSNSDWEPDSFMHFLELRTIFANFPQNLSLGLGVWTKPLYAYPLGFLVQITNSRDLIVVQIINILISLLICFLVYKIVLKLFGSFKVALLSIFLTAFSLTLFKSSVSTLTDQIFSLMLVLGAYFALEKRYLLASLFFGLSITARIEGAFFVLIYNLYLIVELRRNSRMLHQEYLKIFKLWVVSVLPLLIWNFLGFLISGEILYVVKAGYPATAGVYGFGGWSAFPKMFVLGETLLVFLFLIGSYYLYKNLRNSELRKKIPFLNFQLLIWIMFSAYFVAQVLLWKLGIFGNAGLMRYFVSVIPFMVVFASFGALKLLELVKPNFKNLFLRSLVLLQIVLLSFHLSGTVFKQDFVEDNSDFKLAGEWIKNNVPESEFVYADRPEVLYYAGRNLTTSANSFNPQYKDRIHAVYVWSKDWGKSVYGLSPDDFKKEKILYKIDESIYVLKI